MKQLLDCDVLIIGGGVTGVAAATAAARYGAKTILLESKPFVGGNATTGLCLHNYVTRFGRQVVFGIAQEMVDRLIAMGGAVGHIPFGGFVHSVTPVDGELFRLLSTQMLDEAGVTVLYGATRNMAPCLVMGQSAGVAAAQAAQNQKAIPELDIPKLQDALEEQGVFLGERGKRKTTSKRE